MEPSRNQNRLQAVPWALQVVESVHGILVVMLGTADQMFTVNTPTPLPGLNMSQSKLPKDVVRLTAERTRVLDASFAQPIAFSLLAATRLLRGPHVASHGPHAACQHRDQFSVAESLARGVIAIVLQVYLR